MKFSVLFVSTGNICRSPVAERLFRARSLTLDHLVVRSAGTDVPPGWGIDGSCATALNELGVDPKGHVSRGIDDRMVDEADLVLTASGAHRGMLLRARPSTLAKTFTMREFVRIADNAPRQRHGAGTAVPALKDRVRVIADQRGIADVPAAGADDIADPFGEPIPVVRNSVADISRTVDATLRALHVHRDGR